MFGSNGKKTELPLGGRETLTFLARGFEFKGSLTFEGTVRIDGTVEGEIRSSGTVILGEHAIIEGDVRAETVVSGGRVKGNVVARERVHLLPSAVVHGDVIAPLVQIEEGVRFHGSCEAEGRAKRKGAEELREAPPAAVRHRVS
ncbi:MAG TPA: polymer-forming cytoskeletal protein [Nitrospirales bacterium]|jgi:cytoskeletal protein CcmA (bactofilin family)|nr:polymer-forming cytoskeletal protein [Nitrospirales bacterium]